jgi:transcriptional antiterminator RfaH
MTERNTRLPGKKEVKVKPGEQVVGPEWYILKTKPKAEELVKNAFKQYSIESYLPLVYTRNPGRKSLKTAPLFPGYVFFQLELESNYWAFIRWAPGVSYVLNDGDHPTALPVSVIEEIKTREAQNRLQKLNGPGDMGQFNKNEPLKIISGPLAGLEAVFEGSLSSRQRVKVLVRLLGRLTSINVGLENLERAV